MGRPPRITRPQVLEAARAAFGERGFEGTTLAAIAARLNVSPAALLRHAPTKEALFREAMSAPPEMPALPLDFLARPGQEAQPREVLRTLALLAIPFIERELGATLARFLHSPESRTIELPYDPRQPNTPVRLVFLALTGYFRRLKAAGTLPVHDPEAAALAFMGTMNAYVLMHRVMRLVDPPIPLERYVDTIVTLWTAGAAPPAQGDAPPMPRGTGGNRPAKSTSRRSTARKVTR